MTRQEWTVMAKALAEVRKKVSEAWPPKGGYTMFAADVHDRKLIRGAKLQGIDDAARCIATRLKARSVRFNERVFLEIVGVGRD